MCIRDSNRSVCAETFTEDTLLEMRKLYDSGEAVKVRFIFKITTFGDKEQIGSVDIIVRKRTKTELEAVREIFRGNIRIYDAAKKIGNSKAHTIFEIPLFMSKNREESNPISEYFKFCEDPGHKNWSNAVNRDGNKRYKDLSLIHI